MNLSYSESDVTVVIVSFNTKDYLRKALSSLPESCEIIVVDNASQDGSVEMVSAEFPFVRLVANVANLGFGVANNIGLQLASRPLILLMNSDAEATPGAVASLAEVFAEPDVVAAGGKLEFPDGRLQESCAGRLTLWAVLCEQTLLEKAFPRSRFLSPYWQSHRLFASGNGPFDVAQVMGACLMMRPLERFDERFFLYCEDTELCRRLKAHGRIVYVPKSTFVHHLGKSTSSRWQSVARYNRGKELYFALHEGLIPAAICWLLNRTGALLRLLIWTVPTLLTLGLVRRFRHQTGLFLRVLFSPIYGPPNPRIGG